MSILRNLNPIKTRIFKILTSSFKNSKTLDNLKHIEQSEIKRVLITRANHRLGNQLLLSPLIQWIENEFPNCQIDLLVNGSLSNILFANYTSVDNIYNLPKKPFKNLVNYIRVASKLINKKYDIAITAAESSNSSKIFVKLSHSTFKIYNTPDYPQKPIHMATKPIHNLLYFLNETKVSTINTLKLI